MTGSLKNTFKNKNLFKTALTHKSWVNEHKGSQTNERLEFLGDAILEFVVSEILFKKFPQKSEGYLTTLRANIVNTKNLSKVGKKMKIEEEILLSKGEDEAGGRTNSTLIANTVEAIIGAIYLDQGLEKTSRFIETKLLSDLGQKIKGPLKDAKSRLQEKIQAKGFLAPRYKILKQSGPDHKKHFVVGVFANKKMLARGEGGSKAEAEQAAAGQALVKRSKEG